MIGQGPETGKFTVSELCSRFSPNNAKSMEQRIRRAVNAGLTNLANMGLEDYSNDTFQDLAGRCTAVSRSAGRWTLSAANRRCTARCRSRAF